MDNGDTEKQAPEPAAPEISPSVSVWRTVLEWIRVILIALIISLPIRYFIAEPFIVDGASMDPTFATSQFLIIDRISYRFELPARGDVIVFQYPKNPDVYYIKRIIALPGETIDISYGKVTITNTEHPKGFVLTEPYVDPAHAASDSFHEKLGATEYFVMGDNRAQSSDSRIWGPLDRHFITGRALVRLFPITTIGLFPGEHPTYP